MIEQKSIGINLGSGSDVHLSDVVVNGADIGLKGRDIDGLNIDRFTYEGDGKAFDIIGGRTSINNSRVVSSGSAGKSHVGYTPTNAPPLPAYCPRCHSVFPSRRYDIRSSSFYGFDNEETCRNLKCGYEHAKLADGLFDLSDELVRVIQSDQLTIRMLQAVSQAFDDLRDGKISTDEATKIVEAISPNISHRFKSLSANPHAQFWFTTFLTVFLFVVQNAVLTEQADECVIFHTQTDGGYKATYEIRTAADQCFGIMDRLTRLNVKDDIQEGASVESNEKAPDQRLSHLNDKLTNLATKQNTHIQLPKRGPVPTKKPAS